MTFRHMHNDIRSEYLLLVVLENSDRYSPEYRHIRATVVRRAVPHAINSEGVVVDWADEYPQKYAGYRVEAGYFRKQPACMLTTCNCAAKSTTTATP